MKIWGLLSHVDDIIEKYGEQAFKYYAEQMYQGDDAVFEMLLVDYIDIKIENGMDLEVYYKGEAKELPDAFWSMVSNTDSFLVETLLLNAGAKSIINLDAVATARSKTATYQRLAVNGIRVPESVVFFNDRDKDAILKKMVFPFVVKPDNGFGGEGVKLIHSEAEFDDYVLNYGTAYIAQEYIASSRGKDIRVVLLEGEFLYATMRSATNKDEFRSNTHVGGELLEYQVDESTLRLCQKIAELFELPLIGLDLLLGDGEFVIAEVNAFPGLSVENMAKAGNAIIEKFLQTTGKTTIGKR